MQKERLTYLLEQYSRRESTPAEAQELLQFIRDNNSYELFSDTLIELMEQHPAAASELASSAHLAENVLDLDKPENGSGIYTIQENQYGKSVPFLRRWWAAASIILLLGLGTYLWTINKKNTPSAGTLVATGTINDIAPGKNGAVLTLADGSQVVLDSLGNGVVATQNGTQVLLQNGGLAYNTTGVAAGEVVYNTMSTPKGRQFRIILPDGTGVWLNAASSLRYPTVFTGNERRVEVIGEAYFEVVKNKKMPFRVSINGSAEVEVLGTHFNVNAYSDESVINTTLLEGSIRVLAGRKDLPTDHKTPSGMTTVLKPGQQAQITMSVGKVGEGTSSGVDRQSSSLQRIKVISNVNIDKVMAWKNGAFNFDGLTLEEVMRQLERWYDIRVQFKGSASKRMFGGEMGRNVNLSTVLDILKEMGVKYEWDGSTLIIL